MVEIPSFSRYWSSNPKFQGENKNLDVYLEENHPNGPANSMKAECLKYPLKVSNRSTPTTQRTLVLEDFEPLKMARSTFQNTSNSRVFALGCRDRMVKIHHIYSYIFLYIPISHMIAFPKKAFTTVLDPVLFKAGPGDSQK